MAALLKQARQQRVTDRGKEQSGSLPAVCYGPQAILMDATPTPALLSALGPTNETNETTRPAASSSTGRRQETSVVLYRAGDLVYIRPVSGGMWIARLLHCSILWCRRPCVRTAP